MFNVGGGELLVILLVALLVLGPQRLPDAARQAGKVLGELRRMSSGFQDEIKTAMREADRDSTPTPRRKPLGAVDDAMTTAADNAAIEPATPSDPDGDARAAS